MSQGVIPPKKEDFEDVSNILMRSKDLPEGSIPTRKSIAKEKADLAKGVSPVANGHSTTFTAVKNGRTGKSTANTSFADEDDGEGVFVSNNKHSFVSVKKRDGRIVPFDAGRITKAILGAGKETGKIDEKTAEEISGKTVDFLTQLYKDKVPTVEQIQDAVEVVLMRMGHTETAKAYILFRERRASERALNREVPESVKKLTKESSAYFANPLAEFVYYRTYSRWSDDLGRRETWVETVDRFMSFMRENVGNVFTEEEYEEVRQGILNQDVCPSMRLLWSAGTAARKTNVAAYNCSYVAPTKLQDFGEIMYILMCGAGLGFSVEHEAVEQLPQINKQSGEKLDTYVVKDSKEGWADAFVYGLETWFSGKDVDFDYSKVRPAGARLRAMGGRASGPQPLVDLINFSREKVLSRQGRRLQSIDVHDIICKIGEIVVAGGVRRSALISLSDLDDLQLRDAKKGQFYITEPQRSMSNNSAVYERKPTAEEFMDEWRALIKSKSGERGIFNRDGLTKQLPKRRIDALKGHSNVGVNPCGEIILRSKQFCNLTSIVARENDTVETLEKKMRVATLLGTFQSTLTHFPYLSKEWKENCEEERLLGISITGYYDNKVIRDAWVLKQLKELAIEANREYADRLGINHSTSITCIKPHGNSSQLLDTASGMHPRFAHYYVRRVRIARTDPLYATLRDQGVPCIPEVGQTEEDAHTFVLEFPVKAPKGAIVKDDIRALDLLQEWKKIKENFTEHNPSVTIYVGDDEWIQTANFLYENWDIVGGLSFLPRSDHVYQLAPYEEISAQEYERRMAEIGEIDFSKLYIYENDDNTEGAKEYACVGDKCELN